MVIIHKNQQEENLKKFLFLIYLLIDNSNSRDASASKTSEAQQVPQCQGEALGSLSSDWLWLSYKLPQPEYNLINRQKLDWI